MADQSTGETLPPNTVDAHVHMVNKPKHDWYQTELEVILTILLKDVQKDDVVISFTEKTISISVKQATGCDYSLELDLAHPIVPDKSTYKIMKTKIEVHLKKRDGGRWSTLEGSGEPMQEKVIQQDNSANKATGYPTSSTKGPKNWDHIEKEVKEEEEKEQLEGDAAVNRLFQKIYGDSPDDVKKAMMKSFTESGGTVLSTNWDEVKKSKVECKPPDGMEYKKWES